MGDEVEPDSSNGIIKCTGSLRTLLALRPVVIDILMEAALEAFLYEFFNVLAGPKPLRPPGSVTQRLVTNETTSESL